MSRWAEGPKRRFDRLLDLIQRESIDLAIISDPRSIYYFTGFTTSPILFLPTELLLFDNGHSVLVTGATDAPVAERTFGGEVVIFTNYDLNERILAYPSDLSVKLRQTLAEYARKYREVHRVGLETWSCPQIVVDSIRKVVGSPDYGFYDLSESIQSFRMKKDYDEIQNIRKSCELDDFAYSVAKKNAKPGLTEVDIYGLTQYELAKKVGSFQFFSGNFTSGERSLDPMGSGEPTLRKMKSGETIVLDLWVTTNGYWADTCRTFVIGGNATYEQLHILRLLESALKSGEEMLRPGVKASEVYKAISDRFNEVGWREFFPHHAGHGIGLDAWERPFLIPGSNDILEEGMVCALEPGIYLPKVGGIRIENDYVVREDRAETLSHFPLDL
jgi:Xaa-Pro dipeptidase